MILAAPSQGDHQDGPVPEIEGIGIISKPNQEFGAQDPIHAEAASSLSRCDHCNGSQGWPERNKAGERRLDLQQDAAAEHGGDADPSHCHADRFGKVQGRQDQGNECSEGEFP